jgi:hypothetical protein
MRLYQSIRYIRDKMYITFLPLYGMHCIEKTYRYKKELSEKRYLCYTYSRKKDNRVVVKLAYIQLLLANWVYN